MPEIPTIFKEAEQSDLQSSFAYWDNYLNTIETSIDEYAGTREVPDEAAPDGWQPIWDITKIISEDPTLEAVSQYFELSMRDELVTARIMGREPRSAGDKFTDLLYRFEDQNIAELIAQEPIDGTLHKAVLQLANETIVPPEVMSTPLKVLRDLYGVSTAVELLGVNGDAFSDQIHEIMKTPNAIAWAHHIDQAEREKQGEMKWEQRKEWYREWMASGLTAYLDIDNEEAYRYVFSAAVKMKPEDLVDLVAKFDHFGLDQVRKLSSATNIYGIEAYNEEQLERMVQFANSPTATAEALAGHDVIVTLVNRVGDHNGVLKGTAQEVDDTTGRVLFFEINSLSDIYRRMTALTKAGIHPSTLVLASHSNEGRFIVSDDRDPSTKKLDVATVAARRVVEMVNESDDKELNPDGQKGYSMHGMRGMARLVNDFMSPSRGIDDDQIDKGRKKIILSACYAGKEIDIRDLDAQGERVTVGRDSVVGRLANDFAEMGVTGAVDIYGGPDGIQMHRTEHGLRYSGQPIVSGDTFERTKLHAVRARLENGSITKTDVDEIPMRKA